MGHSAAIYPPEPDDQGRRRIMVTGETTPLARPPYLFPDDPTTPAAALRLAQLADELAAGASFNTTRLTVLKAPCKNPQVARRLVGYLLWRTFPDPTNVPGKVAEKELIRRGLREIQMRLISPRLKVTEKLRTLFHEIVEWQNERKRIRWGSVRIIKSNRLLLVGYALRCFLSDFGIHVWAYNAARLYAEKYDSQYGSGLNRASARFVRDLADFWCAKSIGGRLS